MTPIATAGILIIREGKALLVRHGESASHLTGKYGLPAGRPRDGEDLAEAAIRELKEETGFWISRSDMKEIPGEYVATIDRKDGSKVFSMKVFVCRNFSGKLKSSDEAEPVWVEIGKIGEYDLLPNVEKAVKDGYGMEFDDT